MQRILAMHFTLRDTIDRVEQPTKNHVRGRFLYGNSQKKATSILIWEPLEAFSLGQRVVFARSFAKDDSECATRLSTKYRTIAWHVKDSTTPPFYICKKRNVTHANERNAPKSICK